MSFAYRRPDTIDAACRLAASGGRILAGGQSLMPLINRGALRPSTLVDINRLPGLDAIAVEGDEIEIGALARLETVRTHPLVRRHLPLLADALVWVANPAIRRRGTLVGNVVNGGPGAETVAAVALLNGTLIVAGPGGRAPIGFGADLGRTLALALRIPGAPAGTRAGFYEAQRRFGHLGLVGAGVMRAPGAAMRVVLSGVTEEPLIAFHIADRIAEGRIGDADLDEALTLDLDGRAPREDLHATARYRRAIVPPVIRRALARAGLPGGDA